MKEVKQWIQKIKNRIINYYKLKREIELELNSVDKQVDTENEYYKNNKKKEITTNITKSLLCNCLFIFSLIISIIYIILLLKGLYLIGSLIIFVWIIIVVLLLLIILQI